MKEDGKKKQAGLSTKESFHGSLSSDGQVKPYEALFFLLGQHCQKEL